MNRFFGMMPSNEVEKEKWYLDDLDLQIGVQAGPHGWTIMWADDSATWKDNDATTEENFNEALQTLKDKGFNLREQGSEIEKKNIKASTSWFTKGE